MPYYDNEVPSGLVNGTNAEYLLASAPSPAGSLILSRNGVIQDVGTHFTLLGRTVTFQAGYIPQGGDTLRAWYRVDEGATEVGGGGLYRDEAVQIIMRRLGKRTGLETDIISELQAVQSKLQEQAMLPWFLMRTYEFSSSAASFIVPGDFIRELDDTFSLWLLEDQQTPMKKDDYDFLAGSQYLWGTGKPSHYALKGSSMFLFKMPDTSYNFRMFYFGADVVLSSNIKNGWLTFASDLLISEAGFEVAMELRDYEAAKAFDGKRQKAAAHLAVQNAARAVAATSNTLGG